MFLILQAVFMIKSVEENITKKKEKIIMKKIVTFVATLSLALVAMTDAGRRTAKQYLRMAQPLWKK